MSRLMATSAFRCESSRLLLAACARLQASGVLRSREIEEGIALGAAERGADQFQTCPKGPPPSC